MRMFDHIQALQIRSMQEAVRFVLKIAQQMLLRVSKIAQQVASLCPFKKHCAVFLFARYRTPVSLCLHSSIVQAVGQIH